MNGPEPPARRQHTLAFDANRRRVILFGGFDRIEGEKVIFGDTWEFDGSKWTSITNNPELARDHHAMSYDPRTKSVMLFGGYNNGYLGDTWFWKGQGWVALSQDGPARAGKPALVYNSMNQKIQLFGGGDDSNMYLMDFWEFNIKTRT